MVHIRVWSFLFLNFAMIFFKAKVRTTFLSNAVFVLWNAGVGIACHGVDAHCVGGAGLWCTGCFRGGCGERDIYSGHNSFGLSVDVADRPNVYRCDGRGRARL